MLSNRLVPTLLLTLIACSTPAPASEPSHSSSVARGRYLAIASGCNDCHTDGYMEAEGKIPEPQWLTGSPVGFQGPWGTSYPANLRLLVQTLSQEQWLKRTSEPMRPPMPWFNLRELTDSDRLALYDYLRSLGPAGEPAPAAAPPGVTVTTPYFDFAPKNLPQQALQQ